MTLMERMGETEARLIELASVVAVQADQIAQLSAVVGSLSAQHIALVKMLHEMQETLPGERRPCALLRGAH